MDCHEFICSPSLVRLFSVVCLLVVHFFVLIEGCERNLNFMEGGSAAKLGTIRG